MNALYQKQILAMAHKARASSLDFLPSQTALCDNPVCGDRVSVSIAVDADIISAMHVDVKGCALCEAGAGLLLDCVNGKPLNDITYIREQLERWLATDAHNQEAIRNAPSNIHEANFQVFEPVKAFRNRHKCVLLAFEACQQASYLFRTNGDLAKNK